MKQIGRVLAGLGGPAPESPIEDEMLDILARRLQFQKVAEPYSAGLIASLAAGEYPADAYVFSQHRVPPYRVDFLVVRPSERYPLAIECDGAAFHDSRAQMMRDYKREQFISEQGYSFLRFRGIHIRRDPGNVAARILEALGLGPQFVEDCVPSTVAGVPWEP
jgi:very-short-patch-repair endonuclease